ncbi:MAG: hypothetical protein P1P90_06165 [Patescibacteria group bacterium]|nr:hypothetical protein [Patescibacteria group bacterium]
MINSVFQTKKIKTIFLCIFVLLLFFILSNVNSTQVLAADDSFVVPRLNVDIPGLDVKDFQVTRSAQTLSVPFFAVYVIAFYKYILGIGLIASAIIVIYGGYLYLLGATGMQVQSGKEKIKEALMGLVILLGAYVIITNVNPNLVRMNTLNIPEVMTNEFILHDLSLQTSATAPSGIYADSPIVPDPEIAAVKPIVSGKCRAILAIEKELYIQNVSANVNGTDFGYRIRQAAEFFADCGINMNNCGNVAQCAWMAAGVNGTVSKNGICTPVKGAYKTVTPEIGGDLYTWAYGRRCVGGEKCLEHADAAMRGNEKRNIAPNPESAARWQSYFRSSDQCGGSMSAAIALVRDHLAGSLPNYPNDFADRLEPGDWVYIYAGNTECDGMHSMIFLGWHESKKGVAWILDGSIKQNPKIRERCLKNEGSCAGRYSPITRIMRPNFDKEGVWLGN